ncbi:uncharacterized protein MONBRDRAFT_21060 [Monosiga brevicollis MX1]|uniref:Phosphoglycolate phosphatase n=1 Tax=Monosiga brevicollis TaxID=81824 RepID=A9UQ53_MONBE|nr:uncharacterized protein MONBRDRAFT_21060 [Monosiga brevicollis MX1]EDQ92988.1 predicted protein [Monosiga brevicollis MX1]|eukprot:XP_001742750.1 hypothetical protein [Monosiga brevicollis MX1]
MMNVAQCRALIESTKLFVFDCDGVIWRGATLIDGVADALDGLRRHGKRVAFITNNSTKTRANFVKKFHGLGLTWVERDDVWSSASAAAAYLTQRAKLDKSRKVYVVGQSGLCEELCEAGYTVLGGPDDEGSSVFPVPERFEVDPAVGAVVVGFDRAINYYKLAYATMCARENKDCLFLATNRDAITHLNDEQEFPGGGTMVAALETAIGRAPEVAGKPSPFLVDALYAFHGLDRDSAHAVMVGDRLDTDIIFGNTNNMATLLVMSGVTRQSHVDATQPGEDDYPTYIAPSLKLLADTLAEM